MEQTNISISIMGNFDSFKATHNIIVNMLNIFKEYSVVPSSISGKELNFNTGQMIETTRLKLIFDDGQTELTFLPDRINCEFPTQGKDGELSLSMMEEKTLTVFAILFNSYDCQVHRLAYNLAYKFGDINLQASTNLINKLLIPFPPYESELLSEMFLRLNSRVTREINGLIETINCITTINNSPTYSDEEQIQSTSIVLDINTDQNNSLVRFQTNELKEFINIARNLSDKVVESLGGIWNE